MVIETNTSGSLTKLRATVSSLQSDFPRVPELRPARSRLAALGPKEVHRRAIFSGGEGGVGDSLLERPFVRAPGSGER